MKQLTNCFILFFLIHTFQSFSQASKDKYAVVKLEINNPTDVQYLTDLNLDIDHFHVNEENTIEFYINHEELNILDLHNFDYEVLIPDFSSYYKKRAKQDKAKLATVKKSQRTADHFGYGSMGGFYTLAEIEDKLDEMSADFPNLATPKYSIGTSIEGRSIWAVKISDNPNVDEPEDVVHFDALHHAREPLSMAVGINFAFWLLENYDNDPQVKYLVDNREIYLVPCVNPDGYEYNRQTDPNGGGLWRKNRRDNGGGCIGVDLNRNYSFGYNNGGGCSSSNACSNTYHGNGSFSEPESTAIRDMLAANNPKTAFSIHSTAGSYLMPYGYDTSPPQFDIYSEWASDFLSENDYPYGVTFQMLGYTSCGTTRDYMHSEGIYGWTPEIDGSGFWPAESEIFDLVDENVYPLFYQAWMAGQYTDIQSHDITGSANPGSSFNINVEVKNKAVGSAPSNVNVEVISTSPNVTVSGNGNLGSIAARTKATTSDFTVSLDSGFSGGEVALTLIVNQDGVEVDQEIITVPLGTQSLIFEDDAESGTGNWTSSGNGISWGVNQDDSYGGNSSFGDSDNSNAQNNTLNYFTLSNNINLTGTNKPILEFFSKWSQETGDFVNLQISTNGGSSWSTLNSFTDAEPWHQESFDLTAYQSSTVKIRFLMDTDGSIPGDGFYFDKLSIIDYSCDDCPACPSAISTFPYEESFESGTGDWTQGGGDDLNWTRDSGGTPSSGTGPSSGADGSWYMYIEASGNGTGYPNKTAIFVSPCFDLSAAGSATMDFSYHMYGTASQMNLDVQTSIDGGASWSTPIWTQTGNQGNQWNAASLNLDAYAGEMLTLRYFGTTGESWQGDITIDNVMVSTTTACAETGDPCDDGDDCTENDTYDINCNCVGVFQDSDSDGVCDADDHCDGFDDNLIGTACNDGDDCTTSDTIDTNCQCTGTYQDADGDGVCDAEDQCSNLDDNMIGMPCNDGDDCTDNDIYVANGGTCNCIGTLQDADGDGVCDADDICSNFDDNLLGAPCDDGDVCTENDTYVVIDGSNCGCIGTYQDSDNDGVCNANDVCSNFDDTLLGMACDDGNNCTENDTYSVINGTSCGCNGILQDSDGDGVCDDDDVCPGFDDALIGTACDDGDPCYVGETWQTDCTCGGGSLLDDNANGICDLDETCVGILPESESFESSLGVWTQGTDDNLNWTRDSGGTPSTNTGPSTGADGAWYMYIEASGNGTGYPNKTASLVSDCYNIATTGGANLDFSYHMWGSANTMTLEVQVSTDEGSTWSSAIWSIVGNQGNQWNDASINLDAYVNSPMMIRFFGTTGSTWQGDIAIDAVNIYVTDGCSDTGLACDDGNDCTVSDVYDANCVCAGVFQDSDGDGVCDADDVCDGFDDNLIGTACDNGDPCFSNETWQVDCSCGGGTLLDDNNNGICDIDEAGCTYETVDFEDYEGGWGIWNDGGADCRRSANDASFAYSGTYCFRLRDNTSTSVATTDVLDLSSFDELTVDFTYIGNSMETNEDLWLQISTDGGGSYTTVADYDSGDEFINGIREFESVVIDGPFTNNTLIRFRCDASGNADRIFIDDVDITGCNNGSDINEEIGVQNRAEQLSDLSFKVYPNPAESTLFIESTSGQFMTNTQFKIYDANGKHYSSIKMVGDEIRLKEFDLSELTPGVYMISIFTDKGIQTKRFIKQ